MGVVFCDKCGSVMYLEGKRLRCRKCKSFKIVSRQGKEKDFVIKQEVVHNPNEDVYTVKEEGALPTTKAECPECSHETAYYWFEQTRSLDEPSTRFFRCLQCKNTWREYS
ncbi:MAG: transcription factor S [archaeon]